MQCHFFFYMKSVWNHSVPKHFPRMMKSAPYLVLGKHVFIFLITAVIIIIFFIVLQNLLSGGFTGTPHIQYSLQSIFIEYISVEILEVVFLTFKYMLVLKFCFLLCSQSTIRSQNDYMCFMSTLQAYNKMVNVAFPHSLSS